ncbi:RNA polymerase sigma factor [Gynurincola endophyticus]|uniref:RNA polymerase sigma factor n=1 Tax=Gynurincola endophyticus TaxID=2479004 RepID=UPI000F8E89CE|nr:RNA polymerase sigma factor [Gynurincola endophyticus]
MENFIQKIKEGDEAAFTELYEQYHVPLQKYIFQYTRSTFLSEEVTQIAFSKLWEKRENISQDYPITVQLFRIAKSSVIDLLRKEKFRYVSEIDEHIENTTTAPVVDMHNKENLHTAIKAIEGLPPVMRKVFKLNRIEGYSYKEIAALMQISSKTVESHLYKAVKQLKKKMEVLFFILF